MKFIIQNTKELYNHKFTISKNFYIKVSFSVLFITFLFFNCSKNESKQMFRKTKNKKISNQLMPKSKYIEIEEIENKDYDEYNILKESKDNNGEKEILNELIKLKKKKKNFKKKQSKKDYLIDNSNDINQSLYLEIENTKQKNNKITDLWRNKLKAKKSNNITLTEKLNQFLNSKNQKKLISIIYKIEKENKNHKKTIFQRNRLISGYTRNLLQELNLYIDIKELNFLIKKYYHDGRLSPHINLFTNLNFDKKKLFFGYINLARRKLKKDPILDSILKAIENNDKDEIIYLSELIYLDDTKDINNNILKEFLNKSIESKDINCFKYFIGLFENNLKFIIEENIIKDCILNTTKNMNIEILEYLLSYHASKNYLNNNQKISLNYENRNLLQESILHSRSLNIANFLIDKDYVDPLDEDISHKNSFYYASINLRKKNYPKLFIKMIEKSQYDQRINSPANDLSGIRPIYYVINNCKHKNNKIYYEILDLMFTKCNVDPNSESKDDKEILHQVIDNNDLKLLKVLIEKYNANPLHEGTNGLTAFHYAVKKKRNKIIKYLEELNAPLNLEDEKNDEKIEEQEEEEKELQVLGNIRNVFVSIIGEEEEKYSENHESFNNNHDNLMIRNTNGDTSYIYNHSLIIENFHKIDLNEKINQNETFLIYLIQHYIEKEIYNLLEKIFKKPSPDLDITKRCTNGDNILHALALIHNKKLYKLAKIIFQENKISERFKKLYFYGLNNNGETAMDIAIEQKNIVAIELFCSLGYDPANNDNNTTSIHKTIDSAIYRRTHIDLAFYFLYGLPPKEFDKRSLYILLYFLEGCKANRALNILDNSLQKPKDLLNDKIENAYNNLNIRKKYLNSLLSYMKLNKKYKNKFKILFWHSRLLKKRSLPLPNQNNLSFFEKILDNNFTKQIFFYLLFLVILGLFLALHIYISPNYFILDNISLSFLETTTLFFILIISLKIYLNCSLFYFNKCCCC